MDLAERFEGCMLGLAIGDALGYPTEFLSLSEIRARYGPAGVQEFESSGFHPPGSYTDDTQMSIAVAQALVEAGDRPLDALMTVMARHFVAWSESPKNDRAPGATCMTGCGNLANGVHWREAGVAESKGCGSAMRAAPIGLYYWRDLDRVVEVATASSLLTHGHPTAVAAAAGAAVAVALLVAHTAPKDLLAGVLAEIQHLDADCAQKLREVGDVLALDPDEAIARLGEAWVGEEAVADALYCFLRSPSDFRRTVRTGANTQGDSDSIACIAGALSGANNGIHAIPDHWRQQVENAELLRSLGRALAAAARA